MDTKITREWGYRVLTPKAINFYHILLPQLGVSFLKRRMNYFSEIELLEDKSVVITAQTPLDRELLTKELESLLTTMDSQFAQTPNFSYRIYPMHRNFLRNWFLALEGALALIIINQCEALRLKPYDFELINSQVGGIYLPAGRQGLHPFTILFYEDHAKVIHPVRVNNYFQREQIERVISISMRGILQRVGESRSGFEGLAISSYVEEKTKLPRELIVKIVNEKSSQVRAPKYSPLFK